MSDLSRNLRAIVPDAPPDDGALPEWDPRPAIPEGTGTADETASTPSSGLADLGSPWTEQSRKTVTKKIPVPDGATEVEIEDPTEVTMKTANGDDVVLIFTP